MERLPQHRDGIDFSAEALVLFRRGDLQVLWQKGGKYWAGLGIQSYGKGHLMLAQDGVHWSLVRDGKLEDATLGKRLSRALVVEHKDAVAGFLGVDPWLVEQHATTRGTVVLEEGPDGGAHG